VVAARKKRFIDYPRSGKRGVRRWLPSWKQMLGMAISFFGMMIGLVGIAYAMIDIPDPNDVALQQSNVYYWADGERMAVTGSDVNRQNISLEEIPDDMEESVVAAENETFWSDDGIDVMGIGRAMVNMARGGDVQSGSTITQQYVKNMYLSQDQTLSRKARELLLSIKVSQETPKEEILEGYLNTSFYGRGAYGIQAAAQAYYGVDATELNASQCAFLTTLLNGAALYDPLLDGEENAENLERAEYRWNWVMERRVELGTMSQEEYQEAFDAGFPMPQEPRPAMNLQGQTGDLVNLVNNYLTSNDIVTEEDLARGGYQIHTTFDKEMVDEMEQAVESVLEEELDPDRPEDRHVQVGGAAVVPGDGAIRAIYGGEDYVEHYFNNADNPGAQVGSTFKPFVLAAALRDGVRDPEGEREQNRDERTQISPDSTYLSEDGLVIHDYNGDVLMVEDEETGEETEWRQANFEGHSQGEITIREAMQVSANAPFVQLGMDVGPDTVADAAMDAGLREDSLGPHDDTVPSFALGVSTPGPIRMATAYATFAASGVQAEPYSVTAVEHSLSGFSWEHESQTEQTFDSDIADTVTDVLRSVVESEQGSAHRATELGRPLAAKTGTTDDNRSAWLVGYAPQLSTAIGMWRSADSEEELAEGEEMGFLSMYGTAGEDRINGGSLPLSMWMNFMGAALEGQPAEDFPAPPENIGEEYYGGGAQSPEPTPPAQTDDPEPEETSPEPDESESETETEPTPDPSTEPTDPGETCQPWDFTCNNGGTDQGTDQGSDQGATEGGTTEGDTEGETTEGTTEGETTEGTTEGDTEGETTEGGDQGNSSDNGGTGWIQGGGG
jgi:membrane peptidoglycan carboxypeptidase